MNTLEALHWRYATKKFDPTKKVSDADLAELLEAARLSPSSYGLQPWKIYVISDPKIRAELSGYAWNQPQITEASHLIVLCSKNMLTEADVNHYMESISRERGIPVSSLEGFQKMIMGSVARLSSDQMLTWNKNQTYIALGVLLSAAAAKGIDACPMEGFDPAGFGKVLNLSNEGLTAAVLCPVGYRAADDDASRQKKVHFSESEVVVRL